MATLIQTFQDESTVSFDSGKFDEWCVYLVRPTQRKYAPTDTQYFTRLQQLGKVHGNQNIYNDFAIFYAQTTSKIDATVLALILQLSQKYGNDGLEIAIWFTVIYAGMIAEENKENAILKKRIKRLGMHQTLIEQLPPSEAANFSRGKKWRDLDAICTAQGF